jgi:hypothetical protein
MKRSSYLQYDDIIPLGKRGLTVWGYGRTNRYVCRVEVNAAGIAIYTGKKGGRRIANLSWEYLVKRFQKQLSCLLCLLRLKDLTNMDHAVASIS